MPQTKANTVRRRDFKRTFAKELRATATDAERILWSLLRTRQLGGLRFRRQQPIGPYIVDFFCPERRLVIEVDGDQHGYDRNALADARRDEWLRGQGHHVLRFGNREVMTNLDGICSTILAAARRPQNL